MLNIGQLVRIRITGGAGLVLNDWRDEDQVLYAVQQIDPTCPHNTGDNPDHQCDACLGIYMPSELVGTTYDALGWA